MQKEQILLPTISNPILALLHVLNLDLTANVAPFPKCCTPYAAVDATVVEATNQLHKTKIIG